MQVVRRAEHCVVAQRAGLAPRRARVCVRTPNTPLAVRVLPSTIFRRAAARDERRPALTEKAMVPPPSRTDVMIPPPSRTDGKGYDSALVVIVRAREQRAEDQLGHAHLQ